MLAFSLAFPLLILHREGWHLLLCVFVAAGVYPPLLSLESGSAPNLSLSLTSHDGPRQEWQLSPSGGRMGAAARSSRMQAQLFLISLCILVSAIPGMCRGRSGKEDKRWGHSQRETTRMSLFHASTSPYPGRHPVPTLPWGNNKN